VPSSQSPEPATYDAGPVQSEAADVLVDDVCDKQQQQQQQQHVGDETLMHAADAVVPSTCSTNDVHHEAVCRVAKYLSQYNNNNNNNKI